MVEIEEGPVAPVAAQGAGVASGATSASSGSALAAKVEEKKKPGNSVQIGPKKNRKKFVAPIAKNDPDSIEKNHQQAR